jgi:integrase
MKQISVIVFKPAGRPFFHAQWIDPVTGKKKTRSTGTNIKRDAERVAGAIEKELRTGTYRGPSRVTWEKFRERLEAEYAPARAAGTQGKIQATLNAIERHVDPKFLSGLDADQISRFQKALRDEDKLAEASIKGHLAYLHAALEWARLIGLLVVVPEMAMPTRTAGMKGRAIVSEEFERMLAAVPDVVNEKPKEGTEKSADRRADDAARVESWRFLLRGLWWGGLRLGEALALDWTDDRSLCVDLSGKRPMFRVRAHAEKGYKDRTFPMAPEFAEMLQAMPKDQRQGFVFNPRMQRDHGKPRRCDTISSIIVEIGKKAGVKVADKAGKTLVDKAGVKVAKAKYASAHDLRRAFGFRWSARVMPPVLQQLMRHEDISTTLTYYVGRNAEATADAVWDAFANGFANSDPSQRKTPSNITA